MFIVVWRLWRRINGSTDVLIVVWVCAISVALIGETIDFSFDSTDDSGDSSDRTSFSCGSIGNTAAEDDKVRPVLSIMVSLYFWSS